MPVAISQVIPKENYIEIRLSGHYDGQSRRHEIVRGITDACRTHHCFKVLVDNSEVVYQTDVLVEHLLGEALASAVSDQIKIAFIASRTTLPHETHFENVVVNRGRTLRVFWNQDQALTWLLSD
jgi:hypothetical protein